MGAETKEFKIEMCNAPGIFTLVDEDVYEWASKLKWRVDSEGYCWRSYRCADRKKTVFESLHRRIMGFPKGMHVDHIHHNRLDNRRDQLRVCTPSENYANRRALPKRKIPLMRRALHGIRKRGKRWAASHNIREAGRLRQIHVGTFDTLESAIIARDKSIEKYLNLENNGEVA